MRVMITGIAGFVGSYLSEYLLKKGNIELFGIDIPGYKKDNLADIKKKIKVYDCDICDSQSVYRAIKSSKPQMIFHLAAQAFIPHSWVNPSKSLTTNLIGQLNILEAVRKLDLKTRVHIAGSAEEYGLVYRKEIPITENNTFRPLSPYAVGKLAQDMLGFQYYHSYGMFIVRTRAFNHLGPRMSENFVASGFAKQIALIEKGRQDPRIYVGNQQVTRDFTDVRDMVEAYWHALMYCKPGEAYNICSGRGHKIKEILDMLLSLTKEEVIINKDAAKMRPSDAMVLIGDNSKFRKQTGWKPKIKIQDTLKDILNYWRKKP